MIFSLVACGVKESINEKITEKVTEGILEKATGGETDIDIKDGGLTIKNEDGEEFSFGQSEWPEGQAADFIPEFKNGNIVSVLNSDGVCLITIEEVEEEDFKEYVKEVKDAGFTNEVTEYSSELGIGYFASLDEYTKISLMYGPENKTLSISTETTKQE